MIMSPFGNISSAATSFISINRCSGILHLSWKWDITINAMYNAEEMVFWCFENFDKVNIDAKKFDSWKCVIPIRENAFYYDNEFVETLPFRIQILIKDDEDMIAFKLRWL